MSEECLICKEPLEYLEKAEEMECAICHKKKMSNAHCINNHYVCDDCHTKGLDRIIRTCLKETSDDPVMILKKMMAHESCHMHGPEHHILTGAALLTAYRNAGGKLNLLPALSEMIRRGKQIPGGVCGFWGSCGAGISSGIFISIITESTPLAEKPWSLSNLMTSEVLRTISEHGGPRCCKRNSNLSVTAACDFVNRHTECFNVKMNCSKFICTYSPINNQCIGEKCPFHNQN